MLFRVPKGKAVLRNPNRNWPKQNEGKRTSL